MSKLSQFVQSPIDRTKYLGDILTFVSANNLPSTYYYNSFVKANSIYLKSDFPELANLLGSINASSWSPATSETSSEIRHLAYGHGVYTYVGQSGLLRTSTNANNWTNYSTSPGYTIHSIVYGNGNYFFSGDSGIVGLSNNGSTWNYFPRIVPSGAAQGNRASTFGNGIYVAAGDGGTLETSTDGFTWTARTSGTTSTILALRYSNGTFVYAGVGGVLATSTDAITWTARTSGTTSDITSLTNTPDLFLYAGNGGVLASSLNGITWTPRTSGTTSNIQSLSWANSRFFYGTEGGDLRTSADGVNWSPAYLTPSAVDSGTSSNINSIVFGNGVFVYASNGGTAGNIRTSTDAITWTARTFGATATINALTYGNGLFVAGTNGGGIRTSTDGVTWDARTSGTSSDILTLGFNGSFFYGGSKGAFGASIDGINWETSTRITPTGSAAELTSITFSRSPNLYVVGGASGTLLTSTNSFTWTARTSGTANRINGVSYGLNRYAYAADGGVLRTSTDAVTWDVGNSLTSSNIRSLTYTNGRFIFSGTGGLLSSSTDGIDWNTQTKSITSGTASIIYGLIYGNGLYVYGGVGGVLATSTNAITWTARTSGTVSQIQSLAYGTGRYVYGTTNGQISYSNDGTTWTVGSSLTSTQINAVYYSSERNRFIFGGNAGLLSYSSDGIFWNTLPRAAISSGTSSNIFNMTFGNNRFVYVGQNNLLYSSDNLQTWTQRTSNFSSGTITIRGAAYGNGVFVIVGDQGNISTSTDAITWVRRSSRTSQNINAVEYNEMDQNFYIVGANGLMGQSRTGEVWNSIPGSINTGTSSQLYGGVYGNGIYVVVGENNVLRTSTDAITWVARTSGAAATLELRDVVYANGVFVLSGDQGYLATSTDATTWIQRTSFTTDNILKLAYIENNFVFLGSNGRTGYATSNTAETWETFPKIVTSGTSSNILSATYGNGIYVYSGLSGLLATSTNRVNWTLRTQATASTIHAVQYGNGLFISATQNGALRSSTDGVTWTQRLPAFSPALGDMVSVSYTNGLFFAGGTRGLSATSTNGISWNLYPNLYSLDTTRTYVSSVYGNGIYLVAGTSGIMRRTIDANLTDRNWSTVTTGTTSAIRALTYGNGLFVYAGDGGVLSTSTDGVTWTARTSGTTSTIFALEYGNGNFIYGGAGGVLRNSTDAITWTARTSGTTGTIHFILYTNTGGTFIYGSTSNYASSSDNGVNWSPFTSPSFLNYPTSSLNSSESTRALYTTPGTYSWVAPTGVTSVHVLAVGGGGAGGNGSSYASGGGGGGLGWKNSIAVTPGSSYAVTVGAGGRSLFGVNGGAGGPGGNSFFINTSTVAGFGGSGGTASTSQIWTSPPGGGFVGDNGGSGGLGGYTYDSNWGGGGGGAGGYEGNGGPGGQYAGDPGQPASWNSGGAAGGRNQSSNGWGGGGVGILGKGTTGGQDGTNSGQGGSGGQSMSGSAWGGEYGGGGGGATYSFAPLNAGGNGAVAILYAGLPLNSSLGKGSSVSFGSSLFYLTSSGLYYVDRNSISTENQHRVVNTSPVLASNVAAMTISGSNMFVISTDGLILSKSVSFITSSWTNPQWTILRPRSPYDTSTTSFQGIFNGNNNLIYYGNTGLIGSSGNSFFGIDSVGTTKGVYYYFRNPNYYIGYGDGFISRSSDGNLWERFTRVPFTLPAGIYPSNSTTGIFDSTSRRISYTTPGSYTWVAPANVTHVSVIAVGAGGSGAVRSALPYGNGGGGGGLGWKNSIPVTSGSSYTVTVGAGGIATGTNASGPSGGNSFFINISTVAGFGGTGGSTAFGTTAPGGSFVGDGGGVGGSTAFASGGGAGGYIGNGGPGVGGGDPWNTPTSTAGPSAASGGSGQSGATVNGGVFQAGGGIGILGEGPTAEPSLNGQVGRGGSYGQPGTAVFGSNENGGLYGGGGAAFINAGAGPHTTGRGGNGAVTILYNSEITAARDTAGYTWSGDPHVFGTYNGKVFVMSEGQEQSLGYAFNTSVFGLSTSDRIEKIERIATNQVLISHSGNVVKRATNLPSQNSFVTINLGNSSNVNDIIILSSWRNSVNNTFFVGNTGFITFATNNEYGTGLTGDLLGIDSLGLGQSGYFFGGEGGLYTSTPNFTGISQIRHQLQYPSRNTANFPANTALNNNPIVLTYTTPGTYTWIAPANVRTVSAVAVGAGGSGARLSNPFTSGSFAAPGGGGGGLGWKNNIQVVPGQSYTVQVGLGSIVSNTFLHVPDPNNPSANYVGGAPGGNSFFISTTTVAGFGGSGGAALSGQQWAPSEWPTNGGPGGGFVGDGGGVGGKGGAGLNWFFYTPESGQPREAIAGGGGGAGGYQGNGGQGGYASPGWQQSGGPADWDGGGGGGGNTQSWNSYSGGGVGIFGHTTSGIGGGRFGQKSEEQWNAYSPENGQPGSEGRRQPNNESFSGGIYGGATGGTHDENSQARAGNGAVAIVLTPKINDVALTPFAPSWSGTPMFVGDRGLIGRYHDGQIQANTINNTPFSTKNLTQIKYGNEIFLLSDTDGGMYSSQNGNSWLSLTSGTSTSITRISYSNSVFIYTSNNGTVGAISNGFIGSRDTINIKGIVFANVFNSSGELSNTQIIYGGGKVSYRERVNTEIRWLNFGTIPGFYPAGNIFLQHTTYSTPGTYSWVAPANVESVHVVAVGGGGGGVALAEPSTFKPAAGGGGLGWRNAIGVVPGQSYTVVVGAGGSKVTTATQAPSGGNSYFINESTVAGFGGRGGFVGESWNGAPGGGFVGQGGGNGGPGGGAAAPFGSYNPQGGGAGTLSGNGSDPGWGGGSVSTGGPGANLISSSFGTNPASGVAGALFGGGSGSTLTTTDNAVGGGGAVRIAYANPINAFVTHKTIGENFQFLIGSDGGKFYRRMNSRWSDWEDSSSTSNTTQNINSMTFDNVGNVYYYVANGGVLAVTNPGALDSFRTITSGTAVNLNGVKYIASRNFYFGNSGFINFTQDNYQGSNTTQKINAVHADGSVYMYAGDAGLLATSSDFITWTPRTTGTSSNINALVKHSSGNWYFAGNGGLLRYSNDSGTNWYAVTSGTTQNINSLVIGPDNEVYYVASGGIIGRRSAVDTFTTVPSTTVNNLFAATSGNTKFVYAGASGFLSYAKENFFTSGTTSTINSVVFGNNLYVYGGSGGLLASSSNFSDWTARTSGTSSDILSLTYGNGVYLFGGNAGLLGRSTDGTTWSLVGSGTTSTIYSVYYNSGTYFFTAAGGLVRTSTDGSTWTTRSVGTTSLINSLIFNTNYTSAPGRYTFVGAGGLFGASLTTTFNSGTENDIRTLFPLSSLSVVHAGSNGEIRVVNNYGEVSSNRTSGTSANINSLIYSASDGLYYFGADGGLLRTSTDTVTWTTQTTGVTNDINAVVVANNLRLFVADGGILRTSTNITTWTNKFSNTGNDLLTVTYNSGLNRWVYGGAGGVIRILSSNFYESNTLQTIRGIEFANGNYIHVGDLRTIATSTDFSNWTIRLPSDPSGVSLTDVTYSGNEFFVTGFSNTLYASNNVIDWSLIPVHSHGNLTSITTKFNVGAQNSHIITTSSGGNILYSFDDSFGTRNTQSFFATIFGNSLYVTGGANGTLYTSTNLSHWIQRTTDTTSSINGLAYGNGLYVMVGGGGLLRTSTNAITWETKSALNTTTLNTVEYGNGRFVFGGVSGRLGYSSDNFATTVNIVTPVGLTETITSIKFTNNLFVMTGATGLLRTSTDGIDWNTISPSGHANTINDVIFGAGRYVHGGVSGSLRTSTDASTIVFSPNYNVQTQFYVPNIDPGTVLTTGYTTSNTLFENVYVKARS